MELKDKNQWKSLGITAFLVIAGTILWFFFLNRFSSVWAVLSEINRILRPVQYGLILTFILLPVHRYLMSWHRAMVPSKYLEKKWVQSAMNVSSVFFSLVAAGLVCYGLLALLIPQLYLSVVGLIAEIPAYAEEIQRWLVQFLEDNPYILNVIMEHYDSFELSLTEWLNGDVIPNLSSLEGLLEWGRGLILPNLTGMVSNVYSVVITLVLLVNDLFIGVVITIYLLARKDIFGAQAKKIVYSMFATPTADQVVIEVRDAYRILSGFVNGKLLDSLIVGVISLVCCNMMDMPYPVLLATIIGVTNVIPFFGPFIGGIPCGILVLLVDPLKCIYFVIFILLLQQFDGNILGPKILGDSTGLAGFWVIFSILLFGGLFGFTGMLLGVPVFAMIYNILNKLVRSGLTKRGLSSETEHYMGKTDRLAK